MIRKDEDSEEVFRPNLFPDTQLQATGKAAASDVIDINLDSQK